MKNERWVLLFVFWVVGFGLWPIAGEGSSWKRDVEMPSKGNGDRMFSQFCFMHPALKEKLRDAMGESDPLVVEGLLRLWSIERNLKRGELLSPLGSTDTQLYFIASGAVKICCMQDDQELLLEFGYRHGCIFNLPSYFTDAPSNFYIQALRATRVLGIRKVDFEEAMRKHAGLAAFWQQNLAQNLMNAVEREVDLMTASPSVRLERLLLRRPALFQHIPHKYVAQYLRMSPETLSRLQNS
jgi:CRP/FNR family transcriptional regulator, anaerobic regulatory protein